MSNEVSKEASGNEKSEIMVMDEKKTHIAPCDETLQECVKLSITEDKPLMLDYWIDSYEEGALIGVRENGDKYLIKSEDEYTSTIDSIYNAGEEYIVVTENSIYLVSSKIPTRLIS